MQPLWATRLWTLKVRNTDSDGNSDARFVFALKSAESSRTERCRQWSRFTWGIVFVIGASAEWTTGTQEESELCMYLRVRLTLRRPDRLVLCQQMEAYIIQSVGRFMLFLFLSHHCSHWQKGKGFGDREERGGDKLSALLVQQWCPPTLPTTRTTG